METAEVGGPYGMALLAQYCMNCQENTVKESLEDWLEHQIFRDTRMTVSEPDEKTSEGFDTYVERFRKWVNMMKQSEEYLA